jgi:hypothetical protein
MMERWCYCGRKGGLVFCIASCWLVGCGGAKQGQLPTARVAGQVTYRGAPLDHGDIKFIPADASGTGVRVAFGTLDGQGRYRLGTYGQADGAILGDYQVSVEARAKTPTGAAQGATKYDAIRAKSLIPEHYAVPGKSGLTAHVVAGSNTINFDLKD